MTEREVIAVRRPRRALMATGMVLAGALLTGGALMLNERRAEADAEAVANRHVERTAAAVERSFASADEMATALVSFVMSSESIEPEEYERFTRSFLAEHPEIASLQLLDHVGDEERAEVGDALRAQGVPGITELDSSGSLVKAPVRDEYLITWFDAGAEAQRLAPGLNMLDGTVRDDLLERLTDGSEEGTTQLLVGPELPGGGPQSRPHAGVLRPVFDPTLPLDTPAERADALIGAAAVVMSTDVMFSSVARPASDEADLLLTVDSPQGGERAVLGGVVGGRALQPGAEPPPGLGSQRTVQIGDRNLTVLGSPRPAVQSALVAEGRRWILLLGALLTAVAVGSYLWWSRVRRLERLARALEEANQHLERNAAEMERVSSQDRLTGLPNRYSMHRMVTGAVSGGAGQVTSLVLVDLDRFKEVNDSLGHSRGDELLQLVAERLGASVRSGSLGRMGGDEFCVLLTDVEAAGAAAVAERLVSTMRRPFRVGDRTVSLTATAAVCSCPDHAATADELMERVGVALHATKARTRDTWVVYDESMAAQTERRRSVAQELRYALDGSGPAVLTHFQPKVDLATGRIVSAEGLARWTHPVFGDIAPSEFIDVAEETGLIVGIGEEQIQRAVDLLARCRAEGLELDSVSVNVSAQQFGDERLVEFLRSTLARAEVPARSLILEITESEAMEGVDYGAISSRMEAVTDLGVGLSIDDFGTGYSSMTRVERLPVQEVKIDQSFVAGLPDRRVAVGIIRAIISMAHTLGMRVVAEGVETEEQRDWLLAEECDEAQGWLYSRAMDAETFLGALRGQQRPASTDAEAVGTAT